MIKLTPKYDPNYSNQTSLSEVTEEEFNANLNSTKATTQDRIIQLLLFIFGFGWLRLLILIPATLAYVVLIMIPLAFHKNPILLSIGIKITQVYFRVAFFCLGLVWITKKGKIDPRTRCFLFNHQTVIDGPLIYIFKPFTVIGMAELKNKPLIGQILSAIDTVFVDRSKNEGTSKILTDYLESDRPYPMALSPEGKTTKGDFRLQFRTGSFIAKVPLQIVTIRYKQYFPFGKTGVIWLVGGMKEWLIRIMCMPFFTCELEFMDTMDSEEFMNKDPKEKALECNLIMANKLSTKASNRSTRDFMKKKND